MADIMTLKAKLENVGKKLKTVEEELIAKLDNVSVSSEELMALKDQKKDLKDRFETLNMSLQVEEEDQRKRLDNQTQLIVSSSDKDRIIQAKAAFYRAAYMHKPVPTDVAQILNAAMTAQPISSGTGGEYLLPSMLSNELIHEPWVTNPLRAISRVTNITGLSVPKIAFTLSDDSYVSDGASQEETAVGSVIDFGRYKFKVYCDIADTVVLGTDLDLVTTVEDALRSGLAKKERNDALKVSGSAPWTHMSFYASSGTTVTEVSGASMFEAITAALADLDDDFQANARVLMTRAGYNAMLRDIAGDASLFAAPPESVIGCPVTFSSAATVPVVGDFRYFWVNYDGAPMLDSDKAVKTGLYTWVLTAWIDMYKTLASAFRLAIDESIS